MRTLHQVLVAIGDLIDDVVVEVRGPIRRGTDTASSVRRRRGGSAANVAASAAALGAAARFVGQVGDDAVGGSLVSELADGGVDTSFVRRSGATGTIIVIVHADGERTMLTDRRTCADLDGPDEAWLDGATVLHLPLYSLVGGRLAATARRSAAAAHRRRIPVSLDLSSATLLDDLGRAGLEDIAREIEPAVVFANADEADGLDTVRAALADPDGLVTVEKRGAAAAIVRSGGGGDVAVEPPTPLSGVDTTGAGDAFAAGFLTAGAGARGDVSWLSDPVAAVGAGHQAALTMMRARAESGAGDGSNEMIDTQ